MRVITATNVFTMLLVGNLVRLGWAGVDDIWINEIRYDDTKDSAENKKEYVEIAGPAGIDLSVWSMVGYNRTAMAHKTVYLTGFVPEQCNGYGVAAFDFKALQNFGPAGVALVKQQCHQFISYEGNITAMNGPCVDETSTDIGVFETGSAASTTSLQLAGDGTSYAEFSWRSTQVATRNSLNTDQTFGGDCSLNLTPTNPPEEIWINELHYDDTGIDQNEFIEIAGLAGMDLSLWALVGYKYNTNKVYKTIYLEGSIPNQCNGYGTAAFAFKPLYNTAPGGVALVKQSCFQFLSWEGGITAINGACNGSASVDIGVAESPSGTPAGTSLQLGNDGIAYADFAWQPSSIQTYGEVNNNQSFGGVCAPSSSPSQAPFSENAPTKSPVQSDIGDEEIGTDAPTDNPTDAPTNNPTDAPTNNPTDAPTDNPTDAPTKNPTGASTNSPTDAPTNNPTDAPTDNPTEAPTNNPTNNPTDTPTNNPTDAPTNNPTDAPTKNPTDAPTDNPTDAPTDSPIKDAVTIFQDGFDGGLNNFIQHDDRVFVNTNSKFFRSPDNKCIGFRQGGARVSITSKQAVALLSYTNVELSFWFLWKGNVLGSFTILVQEAGEKRFSIWKRVYQKDTFKDQRVWYYYATPLPANSKNLKFRIRYDGGKKLRDNMFVDDVKIAGYEV